MEFHAKIDTNRAIQQLISTTGYLLRGYETLLQEWQPDVPPTTLVFSSLGRAFCMHALTSSEAELIKIWDMIEELLVNGEESVKNAVATGYLEAVLAECSAGRFNLSSSINWLGSETKAYCEAWDEFTGCRTLPQ